MQRGMPGIKGAEMGRAATAPRVHSGTWVSSKTVWLLFLCETRESGGRAVRTMYSNCSYSLVLLALHPAAQCLNAVERKKGGDNFHHVLLFTAVGGGILHNRMLSTSRGGCNSHYAVLLTPPCGGNFPNVLLFPAPGAGHVHNVLLFTAIGGGNFHHVL